MVHIYVDHTRIETAAGQLRTHKRTFDQILSQLETDLAPMIGSWSGEARELYLTKKRSWDLAAADLTALLGTIAQLTEDAHVGYVNTVNDVKNSWT
jgi:ESAT-6 family protein